MTTSDNNSSTTFWTGASVGLAVATIFVCALTGYFVLSGLPRILEAVAFGLAGDRRPTLDASASLTFFLSSSTEKAGEKAGDGEETALGLIVELEDASGTTQAVAVSDIAPMTPPLKVQFLKLERLNRKRFPKNWEPTFQSYEIPLAQFERLDVGQLAVIRFRPEGSGVVILDDIGFRRQH